MVVPVVIYGCESWTIKKAKCWEIDDFELWCWTARRSKQSILKEISPEYSLEVLMLKLKLQCFGHLMQRTDSFEKTLKLTKNDLAKGGDDRKWDDWMTLLTQWMWVRVNSGSWWWTGRPGVLQSMEWRRVGHDWVITELNLLSDCLLWENGYSCPLAHFLIRMFSGLYFWIVELYTF